MAFLSPKKLKKLKENPTAFFVDAFNKKAFPIKNALKKLKPKKYQGFSKYAIVSAVYNVEKYLDDYFKSILNQRLDFKNNILIICVDDGSTDNSAKIIKKYQKKYPQNIFYLYKENGGQASARNLGLEFLKKIMENDGQGLNDSLQSSECIRKAGQGLENINSNLSSADDEQNHSGLLRYARNDEKESNEQKSEFKKFDDNQQNDKKDNTLLRCARNDEQESKVKDNGLRNTSVCNDGIDDKSHLIDNTDKFPENSPKFSNISWVTFTDPDDFLDRDYFYEVDRFLRKHKNEDFLMIACNCIFYFEDKGMLKDIHASKFEFKNIFTLKTVKHLDDFMQLSAATAFFNVSKLKIYKEIRFNEELPIFEDAFFVNHLLLSFMNSKAAFLKKSKYFYRKRTDKSSTLDKVKSQQDKKKKLLESGYLSLLFLAEKMHTKIPNFIKNTVLYDTFWFIQDNLNEDLFYFLNFKEKDELVKLLQHIYSKIDSELILEFKLAGIRFYHKLGILNCFKNEYPPYQIAYIDEFDSVKKQISIKYFTPDSKDIEFFRFDDKQYYADFEKIVQHNFLTRVFIYEKRFWLKIPENSNNLEIFIRKQRVEIFFKDKQYKTLHVSKIYKEFKELSKLKSNNLWILMDRDTEANDDAEHLYRYIAKNYPEKNIIFALRKSSPDFFRLLKEGFKLVDFESLKFKRLAKKASKIISSHADHYILRYFKDKDFIFLQHGVTKDDISKWLNPKKINLFIISTKDEFHSIANDFNAYKFGIKEVKLTGLARHDALLRANQPNSRQILIMPTWRKNILTEPVHGFTNLRSAGKEFIKSGYFIKWSAFLQSEILKNLCQTYNYTIIFNPHPYIKPHLNLFKLPKYIKICKEAVSMQALFGGSDLMITDYSSVAFEMAYLEKPVLYYQFDEEEFFQKSDIMQKGYFNYRKNGFGPVCTDEASLLKELENLLKNECKPSGIYKQNIENTFEFKDGKCCERIYKQILNLDKKDDRCI